MDEIVMRMARKLPVRPPGTEDYGARQIKDM
jgi:hypothetical protein